MQTDVLMLLGCKPALANTRERNSFFGPKLFFFFKFATKSIFTYCLFVVTQFSRAMHGNTGGTKCSVLVSLARVDLFNCCVITCNHHTNDWAGRRSLHRVHSAILAFCHVVVIVCTFAVHLVSDVHFDCVTLTRGSASRAHI